MIISTYTEKALDKIQYPFIVTILSKLETEQYEAKRWYP